MDVVVYKNESLYYRELSMLRGVYELGGNSGNFAVMDFNPETFNIKVCTRGL
jgi:hypothetical protein